MSDWTGLDLTCDPTPHTFRDLKEGDRILMRGEGVELVHVVDKVEPHDDGTLTVTTHPADVLPEIDALYYHLETHESPAQPSEE